jgi:gas vesicle protein
MGRKSILASSFSPQTSFGIVQNTCSSRRIAMIRNHKVGTILTFALGAGVGAAAALLLASKTAEELRSDIVAGARDGADQVRGTVKNLSRRAQQVVAQAQDHVQDAVEAGQEAYTQVKKT